FERLVPFSNFLHRKAAQAFEAELLHAKTCEHTSVNHGSAQIVEVDLLDRACEISGHTTGEGVPCPGRIVNVLQRICAATKELIVFPKKQGSVLPFLNRNILRTHLTDPTPRFDEACFLRYFARFAVVADEQIDPSK